MRMNKSNNKNNVQNNYRWLRGEGDVVLPGADMSMPSDTNNIDGPPAAPNADADAPTTVSSEINDPNHWSGGNGHGDGDKNEYPAKCPTEVYEDFESSNPPDLPPRWTTDSTSIADGWTSVNAGCAPGSNHCLQSGPIGTSESYEQSQVSREYTFTSDGVVSFLFYCDTDGNAEEKDCRQNQLFVSGFLTQHAF